MSFRKPSCHNIKYLGVLVYLQDASILLVDKKDSSVYLRLRNVNDGNIVSDYSKCIYILVYSEFPAG